MGRVQPVNTASGSAGGNTAAGNRTLPPGTVLENRYQVQRVIGRGGMSTVYAARDLRFGQVERLTALKEMIDQDPDPGTRALRLVNFERESALLATIAHAAIPKIYDYFSHDGLVYLVLEYIDGQDLERALYSRKEAFPDQDVLRWTAEICNVLRTLHGHKPDPIIFRDLKPSNIMLRSSGQIALIDFGIARMFQGRQRGTMIGTEGYAPPEQYRGIADARGDIYALGATLHHLLTNVDPRQETPFTFHDRPVREINPNIRPEFASVVMKMVAYHPDQRYQTVEEVEADIDRLLYARQKQNTPILSPSVSTDQEAISGKPPTTRIFTDPAPSTSGPVRRFERRKSSRKRVANRRNQQHHAANEDRIAWTLQTDDEVRGTAFSYQNKVVIGSYDKYLYAIDASTGVAQWKFAAGRGIVARPAAFNGHIIIGAEDNLIYAVDIQDGSLQWSCRTGRPVRSSAVIAGDIAIVGSDDGNVYCLSGATGDVAWRHRSWGPIRSTAAIKNDVAYIGGDDGYIYALDIHNGNVEWRQPCSGPVRSIPTIAGDRVVVNSWHGLINAYSCANGVRSWQQSVDSGTAASPAVAGDIIVIGTTDGALLGFNASDGSRRWEIRYSNQITSTALLGTSFGVVGTVDGDCIAFKIDTGELIWKHRIGGPIVSTPVLAGECIVVGSLDGNVYGIALTDAELTDLRKG